MDKIEKLQEIIRAARGEIAINEIVFLKNIETSVARAEDARDELNRLDPAALDDVREDLDFLEIKWNNIKRDKIGHLQSDIHEARKEIELNGFATKEDLHVFLERADYARRVLKRLNADALEDVQEDLDYLYDTWGTFTGVKYIKDS